MQIATAVKVLGRRPERTFVQWPDLSAKTAAGASID